MRTDIKTHTRSVNLFFGRLSYVTARDVLFLLKKDDMKKIL
jgi:hypothetical protein